MKIYYYDQKHEQVHAELDLGTLTSNDEMLLTKVIYWLEQQGITDGKYKTLVLANNYTVTYNDGEPEVNFA